MVNNYYSAFIASLRNTDLRCLINAGNIGNLVTGNLVTPSVLTLARLAW